MKYLGKEDPNLTEVSGTVEDGASHTWNNVRHVIVAHLGR